VASGILPDVEPGFQPGGSSLETLEALENRALIRAARCRPPRQTGMSAATAPADF